MESKTLRIELHCHLSKRIAHLVPKEQGYFSNSHCIITNDNETKNEWFFHTPGDKTYEKMNEDWRHSFLT